MSIVNLATISMARGALTLAALLLAGGSVHAWAPTPPLGRCHQSTVGRRAAVDPASSGEAVTPNEQAPLPPTPTAESETPQNRVMGLLKKGE